MSRQRPGTACPAPSHSLREPGTWEAMGEGRENVGEAEVRGLRRQRAALVEMLLGQGWSAAHSVVPLNNRDVWDGWGKHTLLCQQSLPLVVPVMGAVGRRVGGGPKAQLSFRLPLIPFLLLVIFYMERGSHIFGWREGCAGTSSILCPELPQRAQLEACVG